MPPRKAKSKTTAAATSVRDSIFKTMKVTKKTSIRDFVEKHKLKFATGKGFYQLKKPEKIEFEQEIVVRRKSDGVMASGDEVHSLLGISTDGSRYIFEKKKLEDFDVFIQLKTYNRQLLPETEFLYYAGEEGSTAEVTVATSAKPEPSTSKGGGKGSKRKKEPAVTAKETEEDESPSPAKKAKSTAAAATPGVEDRDCVGKSAVGDATEKISAKMPLSRGKESTPDNNKGTPKEEPDEKKAS